MDSVVGAFLGAAITALLAVTFTIVNAVSDNRKAEQDRKHADRRERISHLYKLIHDLQQEYAKFNVYPDRALASEPSFYLFRSLIVQVDAYSWGNGILASNSNPHEELNLAISAILTQIKKMEEE